MAINDLTDTATLAHLLKYDSSQGILNADVSSNNNSIIVNGKEIRVYNEKDPSKIPWARRGCPVCPRKHRPFYGQGQGRHPS